MRNREQYPEISVYRQTSPGDTPLEAKFERQVSNGPAQEVTIPSLMVGFLEMVMGTSGLAYRDDRNTQRNQLRWLMRMYLASFALGLAAFVVAIVLGIFRPPDNVGEALPIAIFGGVSASIFLAFFILRPTVGVERATISHMWTTIATNSYWTRTAMSLQEWKDAQVARHQDQRLEDTADDAVNQLKTLLIQTSKWEKEYLKLAREEAARSKDEAARVAVTSPTSPTKLEAAKGTSLAVKVETKPEGQALKWTLDGDGDGSLVQTKPGEFQYTRGSAPNDKVTLKFGSVGDSKKAAELVVEKK